MENATKALLIAGSVLIAILLIAFGMRIFTSTGDTTQAVGGTMDATAATTFNAQFASFLNTNLTLPKANTLLQKIIASNAVNPSHKIKFRGTDNPNGSETVAAGTYKAEFTNGYITNIKHSSDR